MITDAMIARFIENRAKGVSILPGTEDALVMH